MRAAASTQLAHHRGRELRDGAQHLIGLAIPPRPAAAAGAATADRTWSLCNSPAAAAAAAAAAGAAPSAAAASPLTDAL